jgi:hypothetical protein
MSGGQVVAALRLSAVDPRRPTGGVFPRAARRATTALRELPWTTIVLVLVVGVASWPIVRIRAEAGLDPSWEAALGYALEHGQRFGSDIVFTYGPFGFLATAWPWFGPLSLGAVAFVAAIHLGVCAVIVVRARRVVPTWQAAVLSYLAARLTIYLFSYEGLLVLVFVACAGLLLRRSGRVPSWVVVLGGVVTAVGLVGKLNSGVFIGAIVLLTAVAVIRPWWRGLLILLASATVSFLVFWLATAQNLADLPAYAAGSYELLRGYSQTMGVDRTEARHWFLLAYPLGVLLVARIAVDETADHPLARRVALAMVGGIVAFAFFKTGFVRWGLVYALPAVIVALFAVVGKRTPRSLFLAVFVALMLPALAAVGPGTITFLNPLTSIRTLYHEATTALRPWTWAAAEEKTRGELRASFAIEPTIVDALRGHTVEVDPWETAVLVAYPDLTWQPLPVFQSYSAYTTTLDVLNAAVLRGPSAPQRILRETEALWPGSKTPVPVVIDHRNRWFDAPAAMLETFCGYDEVAASVRWEVLALTERRCGPPEALGTVVVRPGEAVTVPVEPRPDRFVIVRIHGVDDSLVDRLVSTLYKSPEWYVTLDGAAPYRLVPGTAVDGLPMAVPSSIVRSPGFTFGPPVRELSIARRGSTAGGARLSYEFLSVPLEGRPQ